MSDKLKVILITSGIWLVLLVVSNFISIGYAEKRTTERLIASIKQDSVKIDTTKSEQIIAEASDVKIFKIPSRRSVIEKEEVYNGAFDTTIITKRNDVVTIRGKIKFNNEQKTFDIILDEIIIKPFEKYSFNITKTLYKVLQVEVAKDPPFYNTFWFGSSFITLAIIIIGLLF